MPKYLVEALTQYRMVYVVDTDQQDWAEETVWAGEASEFGQMHLGEVVVSSREVDDDECVRVHDEINDYLKDWTREQKLARVYKDPKTR
jgi:hypothetical protein